MANKIFAVVDIETTGGMAKRDRITEIAVVLFDGHQIIDRFESLVNPERSIPNEITRITGITNDMVARAPRFFEVAKQIVEMTEGAVFVAHNVRFDYSFIKEEFSQLGYTFTRRQLCTVQLSRKAFPGLRSYSLGNLISHFAIPVENRHRAMDDTLATVDILSRILQNECGRDQTERLINQGIREVNLPGGITLDKLHNLPESAGVYYFYNTYGNVIYVGKSNNIRKRVMQHFSKIDSKSTDLVRKATDLSFEETGHDLIAMLLESREIKTLQPEINKAQRTKDYPYFIHTFYDEHGYLNFSWEKSNTKSRSNKKIVGHYGSKESARGQLSYAVQTTELCYCKSALSDNSLYCFYHQTGECAGAGVGAEDVEIYNLKAELALDLLKRTFDIDFLIILEGRSHEEKALVLIEGGHYRGYGYISNEEYKTDIEELKSNIKTCAENPECNQIIKTYIEKHSDFTILKF